MKEYIELSQLGKIMTGTTPKTSDPKNYESNDINFYKPGDLEKNKIKLLYDSENYLSNYAEQSARIVPENSILVTCIGLIGKIGITTKKSSFNQQINAIIPNDKVVPKYLAYAIYSIRNLMEAKANAPIVPQINKTTFSNFKVPVVPIEEQKNIVKDLEKIEKAKKNREEQLKDCDKFLNGLFIKLFDKNSINYPKKKLSDISQYIVDNRGKNPPSYSESGIPIIDNYMIDNSGVVDIKTANRFITKEMKESFIRKELKPNDVLVTLVGAGYGNIGIAPEEESVIIQNTIGIRPTEEITSEFLYYQLISLRNIIQNLNTSTAQPSIKVGNLMSIEIVVPPIEEQKKFAKYVNNINKQKQILKEDINDLNDLFERTIHKYYN